MISKRQLSRMTSLTLAAAIVMTVILSPPLATTAVRNTNTLLSKEVAAEAIRTSVPASSPSALTQEWNYTTGDGIEGSPAVADIDCDGSLETLMTSFDGYLYCINESGGLKWSVYVGGVGYTVPTIVNIDSDPELELIIGSYNTRMVHCFNSTGGVEWVSPNIGMIYKSAAVADIDGDSHQEVIVGSRSNYIVCLNDSGGEKWAYPTGDDAVCVPSVADLNNDGQMEVLIGSVDNNLYCLNSTGGFLWSFAMGMYAEGAPVIADINEDGALEVIAGSWDSCLYCLNRTGGLLWSYDAAGPIRGCTCGDIDQDGQVEILFGVLGSLFYCVNGSGKQEWNCTTGDCHSAPAVADVDGDGRLEAVVGATVFTWDPETYDNHTYVISENGTIEWIYELDNFIITSSPAVVDIDADHRLEILIGCDDAKLYCFSVPGAPLETDVYPWPSIGGHSDVRSTGDFSDTDGDGLTDGYETSVGTDLGSNDTDGDGMSDYQEFLASSNPFVDGVVPASVSDLAVVSVSTDSITLTWTAPGNNGDSGAATGYVVKYSTSGPITAAEWDSAATFTQTWTPLEAGNEEVRAITGLSSGTTYWFAVIAYDETPNYGVISNSPSGTTTGPTTTTTLPGGDYTAIILIVIVAGAALAMVAVLTVRRRSSSD